MIMYMSPSVIYCGVCKYTAEGAVRGSEEVIQLFQLLVKVCDSYSHCSHVLNFVPFVEPLYQ